jgi:hypothetical protein
MRPADPPSAAERSVMRWLLIVGAVAAIVLIAATWWSKSSGCSEQCAAKGQGRGELVFSGGGRLGLGSYCKCSGAAPARQP